MNRVKRPISLLVRKIKRKLSTKKTIRKLQEWTDQQKLLPSYESKPNKLLIIRLDDIGDYILWRNCLAFYKKSPKWCHYQITLLGNKNWQNIFEFADSGTVDNSLWLNKKEYDTNKAYRFSIWQNIREQGFTTIICPTRIRTIWFDDYFAMSSGCLDIIANHHVYPEKHFNEASAISYSQQYDDKQVCHEFFFNIAFTNWCCGTSFQLERPHFDASLLQRKESNYILCYISASKKSKRLTANTWVTVIKKFKENHSQKIILAGGPTEQKLAQAIAKRCAVDKNITGQVSLSEMVNYTAFTDVVITGDTMQSHMAVACGVPVVIVANGSAFARFSEYKCAGISGVETVYTKPFMRAWKKKNYAFFTNYEAVSDDIKTVRAGDILQALYKLKPGL